MSRQSLLGWLVIVALGVPLLAGCGVDCYYLGAVRAWIDTNGDGVWNPDESPLSGVRFFIDDVRHNSQNVGEEAVSDETGEATVFVFLPGCPRVRFEIYAAVPSGYRLTTEPRLRARQSDEGPFLFGFAPATE